MTRLAMDIGGSNLKWAKAANNAALPTVSSRNHNHAFHADTHPLALARQPDMLLPRLRQLIDTHQPDRLLVTLTAELCDCFATKSQGVAAVLNDLAKAAGGRPLSIWSTTNRFYDLDQALDNPLNVAAANWHALAAFVAQHHATEPSAMLIDVGSTTTDIIPLAHARPATDCRTDTDRLQHGQLVYIGAQHTPLAAITHHITFQGRRTAVVAEPFATTADVHLLMHALPPQPDNHDTPDGQPMTHPAAAARILRMVASDLDQHTLAHARALAAAFTAAAADRLIEAAALVASEYAPPQSIVVSGSGECLAAQLAALTFPAAPVHALSQLLSPQASAAACAYALLILDQTSPEGEPA